MTFTLSIHNYKCWRDASLEIHPLTVLCGPNNVGKSSVIQALVLMRAAVFSSGNTVPLNGVYGVDLGKIADIVSNSRSSDELILSVSSDLGTIDCRFDAGIDRDYDRFLTISGISERVDPPLALKENFAFVYLCAERNGPRDYQPVQSRPRNAMDIGPRGEYATDVLAEFELETIRTELVHPTQPASRDRNERLAFNLQLWMQDFFPDVSIRANRDVETGLAVMRYRQQSVEAEWMLPSNCGFGISYALPVILAGLIAPKQGILLVENPEAHLHPQGQSLMGQFLARVAASGVYVIVETHSDHVLNGIRLACVDSHPISSDDVRFYNFTRTSSGTPDIDEISVAESGNLTKWPKQFFDQSERDLSQILKVRKRGR